MRKRRVILLSILTISLIIIIKHVLRLQINPADETFTNLGSCPACYGKSLCPSFFHGDITLIGGSKFKYFKYVNRKNVFYGRLNGKRIVLKKLAHDWEIRDNEIKLCKLASMIYPCNVSAAIMSLVSDGFNGGKDYFVNMLKTFGALNDIATCPSERLLTYIYDKISFKEHTDLTDLRIRKTATSLEQVAEMMYGMLINPESVIVQAFTQSEGWPFPKYIGSCGRLIVVEYVGLALSYYEDSPWIQRLDLSYQLLQLAQQLTDNDHGFALYLTDVSMDNFAVRPDGTLLLVDVESVVIVDRLKIRSARIKKWDQIYSSKGEACRDCLSFSAEDLCSHDVCDHNYYAICKGLLVPNSYYSVKGLMHSIPLEIQRKTNLSALLKECGDPVSDIGRYIVVPKLLQIMKSLL